MHNSVVYHFPPNLLTVLRSPGGILPRYGRHPDRCGTRTKVLLPLDLKWWYGRVSWGTKGSCRMDGGMSVLRTGSWECPFMLQYLTNDFISL